jgi:4-amino-4-deoxy-L-arabinose transferase-like glycosyltransferase
MYYKLENNPKINFNYLVMVFQSLNWINVRKFVRKHYLLILILLYSVFLICFKATGSLQGDESIYSQVARECLEKKSFLTLYWKNQAWFEKPPLLIWLTMISYSLFGISEISSHIFPGLFGILGVSIIYFFGKELFRNQQAGFLSAFILITTPLFFWSMRSNMMDIPVGTLIAISIFSVWRIFKGNRNWFLIFGISSGLAVLMKSIVGLYPLGFFLILILVYRKEKLLIGKEFIGSMLIFLAIVLPWHIIMTARYGGIFWNEYFGLHVIKRFTTPFLDSPWDRNRLAYLNIFFERSGIWAFIFVPLSIYSVKKFKQHKNELFFYISG